MTKKKLVVILALIFVGTFIVIQSPFMKQARFEHRINSNFEKIVIPTNLELKYKADFGGVILGNESDWGVQHVYSYKSGTQNQTYQDVINTLEKADYKVNVVRENEIEAINSSADISITVNIGAPDAEYPYVSYRVK